MTSAPPVRAQERSFSWAWPAFDLVYLALMFVTATVRMGGRDYPGPELTTLVIVSWVPLLVRRRHPAAVLLAVVVVEAVHMTTVQTAGVNLTANIAMGAFQPVPLASIAAAFTLAAKRPGRAGWGPGVLAALVLLGTGIVSHGHSLLVTSFVVFDLMIMAVGAGVLVSLRRERIARDERDRQAEIRGEVVAERIRIAQDLHDVLAHHLTLVNAQAGVAGYLLRSDPAAASDALRDIAGNTRRALDELRATVGMLREDDVAAEPLKPTPGTAQLGELLEGFRSAGARVSFGTTGEPQPLPAGKDLAVYRIVQEAVTNATKHAPGAPVEVGLHWQRRSLSVAVTNPAPAGRPAGFQGPGTRHGLIGMRERAVTAGGTLTAGPTSTGGFDVRASIPVHPDSEETS
ncbi:sensor histidine kinase [Kineosporia succinea]|uniref:histidine kinase n=1 Tax=Kineosporia succinea TaxID=84632 RepID=A0ABT9P8U6_9ACTN|nr:histidine kinase [Kineosporia succinea]MDP9828887.1 signal transduction histidine kinase [Kineosporia succinea]